MAKLCGRPGCSEPGAAAYGMIPEDLLFWISIIADAPDPDPNVLCRRHADAMVVPRGWRLDDRREPMPQLFKMRPAVPAQHPRRRKRDNTASQPRPPIPEQLQIDGTGEIPRPAVAAPVLAPAPAREPVRAATAVAVIEPEPEPETVVTDVVAPEPVVDETPEPAYEAWQPDFDIDDDLNGLLEVSSPLLARAFRGTGRRRR